MPPSQPRPALAVRATEDRDLVAVVPYLLGYHPQRSVVVLGMADGRLGPAARLDLDDARPDPAHAGRYVGAVLAWAGGTQCVLVVFDDEVELGWLGPMRDSLTDHGVRPIGGWQVGREYFWPLGEPGARRPLRDLDAAPVAAQLVLAGYSPRPDREALVDDLAAYPDPLRTRIARRAAGLDSSDPGVRTAALRAWAGLLGDSAVPRPPRSRATTPPRPITDQLTALLLAAIRCPQTRDALLLAALCAEAPHRIGWPDVSTGTERLWSHAEESAPEPGRVDAAIAVLTHLARASSETAVAEPLAMLAHLHWWRGDGTLANVTVERALESDPGHGLARLVSTALSIGMPPPWRRSSATSWQQGA